MTKTEKVELVVAHPNFHATEEHRFEDGTDVILVQLENTSAHFRWRLIVNDSPSQVTAYYDGILTHMGWSVVTDYWDGALADGIKPWHPFRMVPAAKAVRS